MKNFDIFGVHWKIQFLGGGVHKKKIEGGLPKRRGDSNSLQIEGRT